MQPIITSPLLMVGSKPDRLLVAGPCPVRCTIVGLLNDGYADEELLVGRTVTDEPKPLFLD
jgi:hypothetical protein